MTPTEKYKFKKVKFISGNFVGLTGFCRSVDEQSNDEKAFYGIKYTFELSNGKIGYAYKSEHFELVDN